jgi:hypothetical protein
MDIVQYMLSGELFTQTTPLQAETRFGVESFELATSTPPRQNPDGGKDSEDAQ